MELMEQIVNTDPKEGLHWILISTIDCPANTVRIYDSINAKCITGAVQRCIAKIMPIEGDEITVQYMDCPQQGNSNDCGPHALANAIQLAHGVDPSTIIEYDVPLRDHLVECFVNGNLSQVPFTPKKKKVPKCLHTDTINVYCSCKMPECEEYFECTKCSHWFHPICQGLKLTLDEINDASWVVCLDCYKGKGPRYKLPYKKTKTH